MRPFIPVLLTLLLPACDKDDTAVEYDLLAGEISTDDGEAATISGVKAFGYDAGGTAVLYFSPNSAATCADVTEYLADGSRFDPSNLFMGRHCNVFAAISGFTGEGSYAAGDASVTWNLTCTFGDGSFSTSGTGQDYGYYWSGRVWQGSPDDWTLELSGGGGSPLVADVEMNNYGGSYIYEGFVSADASGLVSGLTQLEWCADLSETPFFGG
jgi:hypothetical protein